MDILILIALLLLLGLTALLMRFSAWLCRGTKLSWALCIVLALILHVAIMIGAETNALRHLSLPVWLFTLPGIVIFVIAGAIFLNGRAHTAKGTPFTIAQAAGLCCIAGTIVLVLSPIIWMTLSLGVGPSH